jgi:hypothetical protein
MSKNGSNSQQFVTNLKIFGFVFLLPFFHFVFNVVIEKYEVESGRSLGWKDFEEGLLNLFEGRLLDSPLFHKAVSHLSCSLSELKEEPIFLGFVQPLVETMLEEGKLFKN